jgi:NADPH-dependent 2,4-dienoyl-CoA reductase/sulfur reductase-like enzyme
VRDGDRIVVREEIASVPQPVPASLDHPKNIVIVGGGAAGFACAEMLRRRGYSGSLAMLSEDADAPCDRPNLSKDYLAGEAPEDWIPLRSPDFYAEQAIELHLSASVTGIDISTRTVTTAAGRAFPFDRLLLATGAEPVRLPIPGAEQPHVFTLRSLADSRAITARAREARSAVVLGSGFIGLETAASLRTRGLAVHVVSLDERPLEKVLGSELGDFVRSMHESHGVTFHMRNSLESIGQRSVTLSNGTELDADLVIVGVGVRPRVALAEAARLPVERGILVDAYLETPVPGIYAAGDAARWRDERSGEMRRVEHWVVAERQGQVAAENMLGARTSFKDVPFFWSAHYDMTIRYVGHAQSWDAVEIEGSLAQKDCLIRYRKGEETLAVATLGRDRAALQQAEILRSRA